MILMARSFASSCDLMARSFPSSYVYLLRIRLTTSVETGQSNNFGFDYSQLVHLAKRGQCVGRNASRPVTIFICPASTPSAGKVASALRVRYFMASDVSTRPSAFATTEVTLTGQDKRLKWIVILGMFTN